jgi:heavy metal efflux system protein
MKKSIIIAAIICKICCLNLISQVKIDLNTATEIAIKNNLSLNNERTKTNYANALIATYKNVPNTNFLGDFGQVNSAFFDTRIGVSQALKLPKTYNIQKQLYTDEAKASIMNVALKETELKRVVQQVFNNYLHQYERLKLVQKTDSIYQIIVQKAAIRLQKGESNILEKTTFEIQKNNLSVQSKQISGEMNSWLSHFQQLLNADITYIPNDSFRMNFDTTNATFISENNVFMQVVAQNMAIAKTNTSLEQTKLLPELSVGYNNGSFRGVGANEKSYSASNRFHAVQFGMGIPIFANAQKAKIKASQINETIAENNFNIEKSALNTQLQIAINQVRTNSKIVDDFEQNQLKNIVLVNEIVQKQFANGDINYLEFLQLKNQNLTTQFNYLDAVKALNESIIQINFLK